MTSSAPTPAQPASVSIHRKVEWVDTDASGHWHNTAVIRLCEMGESALLEALNVDGLFYSHGAPRVRMEADFKGSARFGDMVKVHCSVKEVGRSKIVFAHRVTHREQELASLEVTAVLVGAGGSPRSIPEDVRKTLLQAGPQGTAE